jgi:hypothetical protein
LAANPLSTPIFAHSNAVSTRGSGVATHRGFIQARVSAAVWS